MSSNKVHFRNLDGIRFVLAMMVILGHSMFDQPLNKLWDNNYFHEFTHALCNGSEAVSFFFTLSGFLITYLLIKEKEETGIVNIGKFYMRRILRIWPVYYFVVIFGFFIYPFLKSLVGWETSLPNSLLLHALFLGNFDSINTHTNHLVGLPPMMISIAWSVSIEEQFYLIWPLLFVKKIRFLPIILILIIIFSYLYILNTPNTGAQHYYHTFARVKELAFGALVGYMVYYYEGFVNFFRKLSKKSILSIYLFGISFYIYPEIYFYLNSGFIPSILLSLFYLFIICEQNFSDNSFYKFGNWKFISSQGKYTYGFYMLHPIGIQAAIVIFKLLKINNQDNFSYGIIYVLISVILAYLVTRLSYRFLESYFMGLKNNFNV